MSAISLYDGQISFNDGTHNETGGLIGPEEVNNPRVIQREPLHFTSCSTRSKYFVMCSSEKRKVFRAR